MRECHAVPEGASAVTAENRRPNGIVEQPLGKVTGRNQVLETLLVLDAHGVEGIVIRDPECRDVHLQLLQNLVPGQLGGLIRSQVEAHPMLVQPRVGGLRLVVADGEDFGVQGALGEPLLEDAQRVDALVIEDGVVHTHAALIEDADDRLALAKLRGDGNPELGFGAGGQGGQIPDVRLVVHNGAGFEPFAQAAHEPVVREVHAPRGGVAPPHLGKTRVEIEESDETRPFAREVCDGKNRSAVGTETRQDVVAVLPDRLGNNDRRIGGNPREHLDAHPLAIDEPVAGGLVERVGTRDVPTQPPECSGDRLFQLSLGGPPVAVRVGAKVTACHKVCGLRRCCGSLRNYRQPVFGLGHRAPFRSRRRSAMSSRAKNAFIDSAGRATSPPVLSAAIRTSAPLTAISVTPSTASAVGPIATMPWFPRTMSAGMSPSSSTRLLSAPYTVRPSWIPGDAYGTNRGRPRTTASSE